MLHSCSWVPSHRIGYTALFPMFVMSHVACPKLNRISCSVCTAPAQLRLASSSNAAVSLAPLSLPTCTPRSLYLALVANRVSSSIWSCTVSPILQKMESSAIFAMFLAISDTPCFQIISHYNFLSWRIEKF